MTYGGGGIARQGFNDYGYGQSLNAGTGVRGGARNQGFHSMHSLNFISTIINLCKIS